MDGRTPGQKSGKGEAYLRILISAWCCSVVPSWDNMTRQQLLMGASEGIS
ncbi:MAG: hypothetical protein Q8904_09145 [Bacteroidota bacterium]|nr:hypothetical protein [Bacteroidota bacterium]